MPAGRPPLSPEVYQIVRSILRKGGSLREVANEVGISHAKVAQIRGPVKSRRSAKKLASPGGEHFSKKTVVTAKLHQLGGHLRMVMVRGNDIAYYAGYTTLTSRTRNRPQVRVTFLLQLSPSGSCGTAHAVAQIRRKAKQWSISQEITVRLNQAIKVFVQHDKSLSYFSAHESVASIVRIREGDLKSKIAPAVQIFKKHLRDSFAYPNWPTDSTGLVEFQNLLEDWLRSWNQA